MDCLQVSLMIVFTVLQLAAIALGIAAGSLPKWLDPHPTLAIIDDSFVFLQNAGLWQVCFENEFNITAISKDEESLADTAKESFNQISSDDCKRGSTVENFYKSEFNFGDSQYIKILITRALVILFVLFALIKLITVLSTKCRKEENKPGMWGQCCVGIICFIEGAAATGALISFGLILQAAEDADNISGLILQAAEDADNISGRDVRDYWGIAYSMYLAGGVLAVVASFFSCF
eukprot:TRINITY_DN4971_c0_g1_i14.p1 TRINITY_DN4971_c0_g1~~TRINITY_DN4971_c0_g1_i14.p1  ORF type:complete len:234 (-),score=42.33 TRINITY_DN4971_c0_g1_i14:209-910(-)